MLKEQYVCGGGNVEDDNVGWETPSIIDSLLLLIMTTFQASSGDEPPALGGAPVAAAADLEYIEDMTPEAAELASTLAQGSRIYIGSGYVTYNAGRKQFYAICQQHGCLLTKTRNGGRGHRGRPLGLLAGWLLAEAGSREAHMSPATKAVAYADRVQGRQTLVAMGDAARTFLVLERKPRIEEVDGEPVGLV